MLTSSAIDGLLERLKQVLSAPPLLEQGEPEERYPEMPRPEEEPLEPPEEEPVHPPPGKEDDETTLAYIEMLRTAQDERSRDVALSGLMDLHGEEVDKHLWAYKSRLYNIDPDFIDDVRNQIWVAIAKEVVRGGYDPAKMGFREFAGRMAHTIAGRQAAKGVERAKKHAVVARIDPETETVLKAKEIKSAVQVTPEEMTLGHEIKEYLRRVEAGREPFPYRVRIPPGLPPEARREREAMILDMFMSFYGFGRRRVTFRELKEKYGVPDEPDARFKKRADETFSVLKDALSEWVRRREPELKRLGIEDPVKTYYSLWSKIPDLILRKAGTSPIFEWMEEHLLAIFDIVRSWSAPAF